MKYIFNLLLTTVLVFSYNPSNSQSAQELTKVADSLRLKNDYRGAIEQYTKAISLSPSEYNYIMRGYCLRYTKDYQSSLKDFLLIENLIKDNKKNQCILYAEMASTYDAMMDYKNAITYRKKSISYGFYMVEDYSYLSNDYFYLRDYSNAISCIDSTIHYAQTGKTDKYELAILYAKKARFLEIQGKYQDAITAYETAYSLNDYVLYKFKIGRVLDFYLNKSNDAKPYFNEVIEKNLGRKDFLLKANFYNGDREVVLKGLLLLQEEGNTAYTSYIIASIYSLLGYEQEALKFLDNALSQDYGEAYDSDLSYRKSFLLFDDDFMFLRYKPSFTVLMAKYGIKFNPVVENVELAIRNEVRTEMGRWQEKGEFESGSQYVERMSKREVKVAELTDKAVDAFKKLYAGSITDNRFVVEKYDTESESFKLKFIGTNDVAIISVPISEAPQFKENQSKLKLSNQNYSLQNNQWVLSYMEIQNPVNAKVYKYDITKQPNYDPSSKFVLNFDDLKINIPSNNLAESQNKSTQTREKTVLGKPEVDTNIPVASTQKTNTYCLIIGNEDYNSYQTSLSTEVNVDFASNDAKIFKEYCVKTLGIPEKQIKLLINATAGQMSQGIAWLTNLAKIDEGNAELIFYYSGHGLPDEQTKEAYLIPVDISGANVTQGIKVNDVYKKLNEFPSKKITVFLDACFSGGARNQGLIAMKGVKVKPKENLVTGNMVVFSSSTGEESSGVYREMQHGYMTYFLLKKLQETKGDINYKDFANYIINNVKKETALSGKIQTPQLNYSPTVEETWPNWMLK